MEQEKSEAKEVKFDDPGEVMAQINALGWLLGQAHVFGTIDEDITQGLYTIVAMIGQNTQSMIDKLEGAKSAAAGK